MNLHELVNKIESTLTRTNKNYIQLPPLASGLEHVDLLLRGGIKRGYITELYGPSGGGKTALAYQFIKNNLPQSNVLYIDANNSLDLKKANLFGLDFRDSDIVLSRCSNSQQIIQMINTLVPLDIFDLILIDDLSSVDYEAIRSEVQEFKKSIQSSISNTRTAVLALNQARTVPDTGRFVPYGQRSHRVEDTLLFIDKVGIIKSRHETVGVRSNLIVERSKDNYNCIPILLSIYWNGIKSVSPHDG